RRVHRIHRDVADGQIFVEVAVGGHVPAAVLDAHFQLQFAAFVHGGNVDCLVEHGEIGVFLNHGGSHDARIFDVHKDGLGLIVVELQRNLLQVQDDVGGIFHH